jgi:hypothetical protein
MGRTHHDEDSAMNDTIDTTPAKAAGPCGCCACAPCTCVDCQCCDCEQDARGGCGCA